MTNPNTPTPGDGELDKILAKMNQCISDGEGVDYDYYGNGSMAEKKFTLADIKSSLLALIENEKAQQRAKDCAAIKAMKRKKFKDVFPTAFAMKDTIEAYEKRTAIENALLNRVLSVLGEKLV